jgi:hypothetical protein
MEPRPISPINATSFGIGNSKKLKTTRKEASLKWTNSEKIDQNRSPTCFLCRKRMAREIIELYFVVHQSA